MFKAFEKVSDFIGKYTTIGGLLLLPFFFVSAAGAATVAGATNGTILTSFWKPLLTNPVTGAVGIEEGLTRMFNGAVTLFKSIFGVLTPAFNAAVGPGEVIPAIKTAWSAPIIGQ